MAQPAAPPAAAVVVPRALVLPALVAGPPDARTALAVDEFMTRGTTDPTAPVAPALARLFEAASSPAGAVTALATRLQQVTAAGRWATRASTRWFALWTRAFYDRDLREVSRLRANDPTRPARLARSKQLREALPLSTSAEGTALSTIKRIVTPLDQVAVEFGLDSLLDLSWGQSRMWAEGSAKGLLKAVQASRAQLEQAIKGLADDGVRAVLRTVFVESVSALDARTGSDGGADWLPADLAPLFSQTIDGMCANKDHRSILLGKVRLFSSRARSKNKPRALTRSFHFVALAVPGGAPSRSRPRSAAPAPASAGRPARRPPLALVVARPGHAVAHRVALRQPIGAVGRAARRLERRRHHLDGQQQRRRRRRSVVALGRRDGDRSRPDRPRRACAPRRSCATAATARGRASRASRARAGRGRGEGRGGARQCGQEGARRPDQGRQGQGARGQEAQGRGRQGAQEEGARGGEAQGAQGQKARGRQAQGDPAAYGSEARDAPRAR